MSTVTRSAMAMVVVTAALLTAACAAAPITPAPRGPATPANTVTAPAASIDSQPSDSSAPPAFPLRDEGGTAILQPGTYVLDNFPVELAFDIPDGRPPGWHVGMSTPDTAIVLWFTPPEFTYLFAFWNADNVYVDPCDAAAGELEPQIGSSVDDLVSGLSRLRGFEVTTAVEVMVGSLHGKAIELTALENNACREPIAFSSGDDYTALSAGQTLRLQILDVEGVRVVMTDRPWDHDAVATDPIAAAELRQILSSLRTQPLP